MGMKGRNHMGMKGRNFQAKFDLFTALPYQNIKALFKSFTYEQMSYVMDQETAKILLKNPAIYFGVI